MSFMGPASTIGIIGDGRSTLLLAQQALKMGFHVVILAEHSALAAQKNVQLINGSSQNMQDLQALFSQVDLVIYDNENLHLDSLEQISGHEKLIQGTELLDLVQDRYLEKSFLNNHNLNVVPFAAVVNDQDLRKTVEEIGFPCILKPIQKDIDFLDGVIFKNQAQVAAYHLPRGSFILESLLDIKKEMIVLASKDAYGQINVYPLIQMTSQDRWLYTALVEQQPNSILQTEVQEIAQTIAANINFQGLIAVKLCTTNSEVLYVERIYAGTIFAANIYQAVTAYSQEELFLRSLCDWPLPQVTPLTSGCNLVVTKDNLALAVTELKQHPQWQLTLLPEQLEDDYLNPYLGVVTVLGTNYQKLQHYINSSKIWKV